MRVTALLALCSLVAAPAAAQMSDLPGDNYCLLPFQVGEGVPRELGYDAFARMWAFCEARGQAPRSEGRIAAIGWTVGLGGESRFDDAASLPEKLGVPLVVSGWIGPLESDGYLATAVFSRGGLDTATESSATGASPVEAIDALFAKLAEASPSSTEAPPFTPSAPLTAAGVALDDAVSASLAGDMPAVEDAIGAMVYHLGRQPRLAPYGPSVEVLRSGLVVRPRHTGVALLLGILHLERGNRREALSAFQWARQISPRMAGLDRLIETLGRGEGALPATTVVVAQSMDVFSPVLDPLISRHEPRSPLAAPAGLIALWDPARGGPRLSDALASDPTLGLLPTAESGIDALADRIRISGDGVALQTSQPATAVTSVIVGADEFTLEALLQPADQAQGGPARIVTLSANTSERNLTLGQEGDHYVLRLRTSQGDRQGNPQIDLPAGTAQPVMQHVVATFADGLVTLYVDGLEVQREQRPGDLSNWDPTYRLALANELTLDRQWHGEIGLVALYARALTAEEVSRRATALLAQVGNVAH